VQEPVDLLVDRGDDRPEPVTRVLAGDPAGEVEVDGAVDRLDPRSLRPRDDETGRRDAAGHEPRPLLDEVVGRGSLLERHPSILRRPRPGRNGREGGGASRLFDTVS
jgi:hypothetical protein